MRTSFKEAGAIKFLVQLLDHKNDVVRLAVTNALQKLSIREDLLDSVLIAQLVEILKTLSPTLQRKATSILEFMAFIKLCRVFLVTSDIEFGLVAIFQQKVFNDMGADADGQELRLYAVDIEESGAAISDAS
ncbi:hypothetical protein Nepgr_027565 [Nepenthes gracilis]|uniref:Uncharacterized protein n=1 Tax=Nepenthes gracilis TaxID=150966 RepID=A0AAD3Y1B6_NEPGR|nr:hypothetical protein Nepgr_027565 [Nepenthes gracilis]